MRVVFLAIVGFLTAGCGVLQHSSGLMPRSTTAYREVVTEDDRIRLRDWRTSFVAGLQAARRAGHGDEIAREGALLDPDAALTQPDIPNGMYRCRVIKLGAKNPGNLDFVSLPSVTCRIRPEQTLQRLGKLGGTQRYVGVIFPGDPVRKVFLGTLAFSDEPRALQYGQDDQRDVAGYIERIGPNRWRLVMPAPHFESRIDVMELAPQR
jgi:hypothetical protein